MRLRHRQGHSRRNQAKRTGILSSGNSSSRTIPARPNRRAARLGADQPFDRCGGPTITMVAAWIAMYRRCRACHVAYRRGGNQSRDSRRGCNGEHTRPNTTAENSRRKRALRRPARRKSPTRATQRLQIVIQNNVIRRVLGSPKPLTLPWPLKLLRRWPILRRIPARVIGVGFRPEHVKTPEVQTAGSGESTRVAS